MDIESERRAFEEKQQNKEKSKFEKLIAPDVKARKEIRKTLNDSAYFIIIGLISMLTVFIPPLFMGCLSSDIGLAFPKNLEGWILWCILNVSTAIANISLLILFKLQAKKNSRNNPNFIKANEMLNRLSGVKEVFIPRSPAKMNLKDYTKKIMAIVVSTLTASITITSLILSFDWMTLLSCLISIIITLCISWITMLNNEEYWCEEYLLYAEMIERKHIEAAKKAEEERLAEASAETQPEPIETATESNVSEVAEELSKDEIKETENA